MKGLCFVAFFRPTRNRDLQKVPGILRNQAANQVLELGKQSDGNNHKGPKSLRPSG